MIGSAGLLNDMSQRLTTKLKVNAQCNEAGKSARGRDSHCLEIFTNVNGGLFTGERAHTPLRYLLMGMAVCALVAKKYIFF